MATSILCLSRDFTLTVHHGNFILTGGAAASPDPPAFNWEGCRPPRPPRISWGGGLPPSPQTLPPANYEGLRPSNSPQEIGKTIGAGLYELESD